MSDFVDFDLTDLKVSHSYADPQELYPTVEAYINNMLEESPSKGGAIRLQSRGTKGVALHPQVMGTIYHHNNRHDFQLRFKSAKFRVLLPGGRRETATQLLIRSLHPTACATMGNGYSITIISYKLKE